MKKPREKLTSVPNRKRRPPEGKDAPAAPAPTAPDLSHIAADLQPLAVAIAHLHFDPRNAREHGEKNLEAIKGSLRTYGQRRPVVVSRRTNHVEAGNGVMQAALSLGWTHLAAIFVDDDARAAAGFAIADNRTAELATWDPKRLGELIAELKPQDDGLRSMIGDLARENERRLASLAAVSPNPTGPMPAPRASSTGTRKVVTCPECRHEFTPGG